MNNLNEKTLKLNIGPQHPSTHGVLRLIVDLEGEKIKNIKPIVGYLHRGIEKMAESRTFFQYLPIVDRVDYLSGFFCSEVYCAAVEKLLGYEIPPKASYIRMMLMELNRISSHLMWLGSFMLDLGASSPIFYCFSEREKILALFEELTGQRMMFNYHIFGGVKYNLTDGFLTKVKIFCDGFEKEIKKYKKIITNNPIFISRTKNIGILSESKGLDFSISGANLRASGVNLDLRKKQPYLNYQDLDFEILTLNDGDSFSRYLLRIQEMKQSVNLVMQCVNWLENKNSAAINLGIKQINIKPKEGFATSFVESPRGILGCTIISDGSSKPYRVKWRTSSFFAVQALPILLKNSLYADIMSVFGSLDIILPEVDR